MPVLGCDPGSVRVGFAVADPSRTLATPLMTLPLNRPQAFWQRVRDEVSAHQVELVIVGLPVHMDGSEGKAAASARAFAAELHKQLELPVDLWDERLTTAAAERALLEQGMRRTKRRQVIDAVAAAMMLQSWLDAQSAKLARRN